MATTQHDLRIAARVRGGVAEAGARQADLACALGISQPSLSRRLNGSRSFSIGEILKTAEFLGVPLSHLLDGLELPTAPAVSA